MTPAPATRQAARQSLIDRFGAAGRIRLVDAGGTTIVTLFLATPAGTVSPTGIVLAVTNWVQVLTTADVAAAVGETAAGEPVADFTAGLSTDMPVPDLPLPARKLYAGAFVRLGASAIDCY